MNKIMMVFKKEMLTFFRDKKALITLFLPILIYPVFMIFLIGYTLSLHDALPIDRKSVV